MKSIVVHAARFDTSTGGSYPDEPAFLYCVNTQGYCLSLSWCPGDELAEVMVCDQINHKTREVQVDLSRETLRVSLSEEAALRLEGITEYVVPLGEDDEGLRRLDAALTVIFAGGMRGEYLKQY